MPIGELCDVSEPRSPETNLIAKNDRTKKPGNKSNSLLLLLLVVFTTLSCGLATPANNVKVTQLAKNQPVYFDPVGKVQLIHDEWKLLVYYNLTTFRESITKVEHFVIYLAELCDSMPHEHCHPTIQQLKFELNHLNEYSTLLRSQHRGRRRRGLFNGVGNVARALFGVMDNEFAEQYARDIQKVKNNEQYLLQLIKNQTVIIEAENSIIKKNEDFVKTQMEAVQRFMNEALHNIDILISRVPIIKKMTIVNAGAITASLLMSVLRRTQQMLLNALTDIYRGHLDMELFTPKQLSEQINSIAAIVPKRLRLPIQSGNRANINNIYKIIYVKARLTEQYLLLELNIPLLSVDEYTLYHNIAIPRWHGSNLCQVIATPTKYIGVNFVKNTYIQMEEADLQQCTTMTEDSHICHLPTTISNMHGMTASCEAKILGQNVNNVTCDWVTKQCSNQWTKLHRPNIWLYNCVNECTTRIVCEDRVTTTTIQNSGLLALGQDCILQQNDTTIYSQNIFSSSTKMGMTLEVPTIDSPNDMWDTVKFSKIVIPTLNLSEEHKQIEEQIRAHKSQEYLPYDITVHDIANYSMSTLIVGGIVVMLAVWLIRRFC